MANQRGDEPAPEPAPARDADWSLRADELWIIGRRSSWGDRRTDDYPGSGCLMTRVGDRDVPVPLRHTDVHAGITGYISSVEVTQQFQNPYSSKIEAVYVFPLPESAAVSEFVMTVGARRIRGIVREREEAERMYTAARAAGQVASLLTQERPNIFTQRVANIEPGHAIDISIRYFGTLAYADDYYEFVFPMVVGPRYNPAYTPDGVGAVGERAPGASGQATEVTYLRPERRGGTDISITVDIDAGVPVTRLSSPTHQIDDRDWGTRRRVTLAAGSAIPNKDFVLRYHVAGDETRGALFTHRDERGGYFTLLLLPPKELARLPRTPLEVVFVVDRSGSMDGRPMALTKAALSRGLRDLEPDDTFQIIDFASTSSQLGAFPLPVTDANLRRARRHVEGLDAAGGTEMLRGMQAALSFPHDPWRLRFVAFLTDGFIGNENQILAAERQYLGDARVFSFGVGSSPNRFLMDSMARLGRGAAAYVGLNDRADGVMSAFMKRVSHPALSDISIDFGPARVSEVYPARIPDLFVGRPVVISGRYDGEFGGAIRLGGRTGGQPREALMNVEARPVPSNDPPLPRLWARMKITDLAERALAGMDTSDEIRRTALDYGIMSAYTAFVAVDSMSRTAGTHGTSVPVPVQVPAGTRYETTVSGQR